MRHSGEVQLKYVGPPSECAKYISDARKILGAVIDRDQTLGGLDYAHRQVRLSPSVVISVYANTWMHTVVINTIADQVEPEPPSVYELRMAWDAEGIVLTPVSAEYPDGWGLPTRTAKAEGIAPSTTPAGTIINPQYPPEFELDPENLPETILTSPYGTEGGILNQVLINKFANNKYLDRPSFIAGVPAEVTNSLPDIGPRRRADYESAYITGDVSTAESWQLVFDPVNCPEPLEDDGTDYWLTPENNIIFPQVPGVYQVSGDTEVLVYPQFADTLLTPIITEPESPEQWYCHRPEELLYAEMAYEGIFQQTNVIRAAVGRPPLYRQTRGDADTMRMGVQEVVLSGKQFHDGPEFFRPGYTHAAGRMWLATGTAVGGENLLMYPDATDAVLSDFDFGVLAAEIWRNSPPHYTNQINSYWDNTGSFPGAAHFVHATTGTVDETVTVGVLDQPVSGMEVGQIFHKRFHWVPTANQFHEGIYGVTGWFGADQEWSREFFARSGYVTFKRQLYFILNTYNSATGDYNTSFRGIIGCAAFKESVESVSGATVEVISLRAVVYDVFNEDTASERVRIQVLTRRVQQTDIGFEDNCDWTVENETLFFASQGWLPFPENGVRFSPDGSQFVFGMLKKGESYSSALDYDASDFNTERSGTLYPRTAIELNHIVYDPSRAANGLQPFDIQPVPCPEAQITCLTTGAGTEQQENLYVRAVTATVPMYADLNADNEVIHAYLDVREYTYQRWKSDGANPPETENYGYVVHTLQFPSGKEVVLRQQYFEDNETLPMDDLRVLGWPGLHDGNYIRQILHLDVMKEEIIYRHIGTENVLLIATDVEYWWGTSGVEQLVIDFGYDLPETPENERYYAVMYDGVTNDTWAVRQVVIPDRLTASSNRAQKHLDQWQYSTHLAIETANAIYSMDAALLSNWKLWANGAYTYARNITPMGYAWYFDNQSEVGQYVRFGNDPIDTVFRRPAHSNHKVSVAPGLNSGWGQDNTCPILDPAIYGSLITGNIAPQMASEIDAAVQAFKYRDRIVARNKIRSVPYAVPPTATNDFSVVQAAYNDVPEELDPKLHANFDLDVATGIDNVTDIWPLGRL